MKPQNVSACAMPWHRPLEQLALPDHLGDLSLGAFGRVLPQGLDALGGGLPGPAEPVEPPQPVAGHRRRDDRQGESDDDSQRQRYLLVRQWVTA